MPTILSPKRVSHMPSKRDRLRASELIIGSADPGFGAKVMRLEWWMGFISGFGWGCVVSIAISVIQHVF